MLTKTPRGTRDVLPKESYRWRVVEDAMRGICDLYGYQEIRTPVFEHTELFLRSVGDTTDIVQKEMYTFDDKGGRSLTLKPEGTAGVVRSFIEHGLFNAPLPLRVFYLNAPIFRYEAPQSGRYREHHQFGVEVFGAPGAGCEAELIAMAVHLLERLEVNTLSLSINSIGCAHCRLGYQQALRSYYTGRMSAVCDACRQRYEKNPLRMLDCKVEQCQAIAADAPMTIDHLCTDCREHFAMLQRRLDSMEIPYHVNPMIVRGLDYYTRTVFEIIHHPKGQPPITVCGGGRYDGLVEQCGGPATPAAGFGMGLERLLLVLDESSLQEPQYCQLYVASMGDAAREQAFMLTDLLRRLGVKAQCDQVGRSLKAQFKYADKIAAQYTLVLGEEELKSGIANLRDMAQGKERPVPWRDGSQIALLINPQP